MNTNSIPLQRYISNELIHFVGRDEQFKEDKQYEDRQYKTLMDILKPNEDRRNCLAHYSYNPETGEKLPDRVPTLQGNIRIDPNGTMCKNSMYQLQKICFCDIPIADIYIHTKKYSRFGLSFHKNFIVEKGGHPILYMPRHSKIRSGERDISEDLKNEKRNKGYLDDISTHIDAYQQFNKMVPLCVKFFQELEKTSPDPELVKRFLDVSGRELTKEDMDKEWAKLVESISGFLHFHLFYNVKFYNHALPVTDLENYYFEREWCINGWLWFEMKDVRTIIIPRRYAPRFWNEVSGYDGQLILLDD